MIKTNNRKDSTVSRSGLIYHFANTKSATTYRDTHAEHRPIPVEVRDKATPGILAKGKIPETMIEGRDLYGVVEWPQSIEDKVKDHTPIVTCHWSGERLQKVVIEIEDVVPEDTNDGHDSHNGHNSHDCGCDGGECQCID